MLLTVKPTPESSSRVIPSNKTENPSYLWLGPQIYYSVVGAIFEDLQKSTVTSENLR
jgi:hypothetical protein